MTVRELIEWLKTQDQDATVEVIVKRESRGWYDCDVAAVAFNPELSSYVDLRGNAWAVGTPNENARILTLGEIEN